MGDSDPVSPPHLYLSLSFYLEAFLDFPVFRLQILACIRDEYFGFCPLELALKEDFEKKSLDRVVDPFIYRTILQNHLRTENLRQTRTTAE